MTLPSSSALAAMIDHTLLRPDATISEIEQLAAAGAALGVASVCVPASMVLHVPQIVPVCTVIGFPSGAHSWQVKAYETATAVDDGAVEIDMVVNLGAVADGAWDLVAREIAAVRVACSQSVLKVIVESALWESDATLECVCQVAVDQGADFLKTSTGMHAAGGASLDAVARLAVVAAGAGRLVGVKASGGIRDTATALAMIDAGATRIGASATAAILAGLSA